MPHRRVIIVILDACGVGELPDAADYGDVGAATIQNVAAAVGGLNMPTSQHLGLGNIVPMRGIQPSSEPVASFGKMAEKSAGKDSTSGHWEIAGIILPEPFPLFPNGFPGALVQEFERRAGVKTIGNCAASGTEIIERLGEAHLKTKALILYTSADSVFQLAAHEEIYRVERLYEICHIARELLKGEYDVGRVIARPFIGTPGHFTRTSHRKDFSRMPTSDTVLDLLLREGREVLSIGKIYDLFAGRGITTAIKTADNNEVLRALLDAINTDTVHDLVFSNLVDFDMLWGHRNDEVSFARGLEAFDAALGPILSSLREDDMLIITADHGCDPTLKNSTDHTREYVPLLVVGKKMKRGVNLGTRETFADVGATIAEYFGLRDALAGTSFLKSVLDPK
ncbi:MAG TPA: phosphopentomutase [Candidatus Acidoferrum sp.]|nr:phosphopentomutase [Candidatus Acidoferrum sp.]